MKYADTRPTAGRKPRRVVVLPPSAFADSCPDRPTTDVAIGLRLLSAADVGKAQGEAARAAAESVGDDADQLRRFRDQLMTWAVALATCDVNDVTKPYFPEAEDTVPEALTPQGIRRLYDELERMMLEESPTTAPATNDEVQRLTELLAKGALEQLQPEKAHRARQLLRHVLDSL